MVTHGLSLPALTRTTAPADHRARIADLSLL